MVHEEVEEADDEEVIKQQLVKGIRSAKPEFTTKQEFCDNDSNQGVLADLHLNDKI